MKDYRNIIKNHLLFWEKKDLGRPLLIYYYKGWVYGPRILDVEKTLKQGIVKPENIIPSEYQKILEEILQEFEEISDDKVLQVEPIPSIPWMEAYFSCPIKYTGTYVWAENKPNYRIKNFNELIDAKWLEKYLEFLDILNINFGKRWSISQTILRGISDVACSIMGESNLLFAMNDEPKTIHDFLDFCKERSIYFYKKQQERIKRFHNGYTIGQYFIWTPEKCLRIQEDAVAILSPKLFREFIKPRLAEISDIAEYVLVHLHTTSLHSIDDYLKIQGIRAIQLDIDEGPKKIDNFINEIKKIQFMGKNLILKGRFSIEQLKIIIKEFDRKGLCVMPVVYSKKEIEKINSLFGNE
jgi:hypothetical protein